MMTLRNTTVETFGEWNGLARRYARLGNVAEAAVCLRKCLEADAVRPDTSVGHQQCVADVRARLAVIEAEAERIRGEYQSLRGQDTKSLRALVMQSHRVYDTSGQSKLDLVFTILRARHGQARLVAAGVAS